jgi:hypothetical protein
MPLVVIEAFKSVFSSHAFAMMLASIRNIARNIVQWMKTGRPGYPVTQGTRQPPK